MTHKNITIIFIYIIIIRCWVAGFGKDAFKVGKHSYILKEVDLPIVNSDECEVNM